MRRTDPYRTYLFLSAAMAFAIALSYSVAAVYRIQTVGMNPLELVLTGTVLEAAILICEVPTGVIADTFGRRTSIIIGAAVLGLGYILQAAVPRVGTVLAAQAVVGIGYTFTSGATEAWIAGEIGEQRAGRALLRGAQFSTAGSLAGMLAAGGLGALRLELPQMAGGALLLALAIGLALRMPEAGFARRVTTLRAHQDMIHTLRDGARVVRGRTLLILLVVATLFLGLSSEGLDRLWEAHFLTDLTLPSALPAVVWIAVIAALGKLVTIGGLEIAHRHLDATNDRVTARTVAALFTAQIGSTVTFALAPGFGVGLGSRVGADALRHIAEPLTSAWIVRHTEPQSRATVLSMRNQVWSLGELAGGPVWGAIALAASIPTALVASAVALTPVVPLTARAGKASADVLSADGVDRSKTSAEEKPDEGHAER